ncbi:hypothetical protein BH23GEM9_BH23GEM9_19680 [soil metagenome]
MLCSHCRAPVLLALLFTACAPAGDDQTAMPGDTSAVVAAGTAGELTQTDRSAIENASQRWVAAAQAGNWDEVASLYADDAVLMPPNAETQHGRTATRDFLASFPPVQSINFDRVHIDGRGDLAYVHGRYAMTFATPDGQTMEDRGKYIEIWERQQDGQWRITRDIFNSDMPAQPAPGT